MSRWSVVLVVLSLFVVSLAGPALVRAEGYKLEPLTEKPAKGDLGAAVEALIVSPGYRVVNSDDGSTVCDIWRVKDWDLRQDFKPNNLELYPFKPGSLIGAIRFPKQGKDFRQQDVPAGTYTLRFALQPVSGTHVGTFETRDFLVMLSGKTDLSTAPIGGDEDLANASGEAIKSSHPSVMPLLKASGANPATVRKVAGGQDWWTLAFQGDQEVPLEIIVVGKEGGE